MEIKNNNLTLFNIDSLFQKEFRLKTMSYFDEDYFSTIGKQKTNYIVVLGHLLSGKSTLCRLFSKHLGYKVVDWKQMEEQVKKGMGTEEEPFEGEVPVDKVEDAVLDMINNDKKRGDKVKYVFDGMLHKDSAAFYERFIL